MAKLGHVILISLVTLYLVSETQAKEPGYVINNIKKLREIFNQLINEVTSVNQERLEALKKYYDLQNLPKVSRSDDDEEELDVPNHKKVDTQRGNIIYLYNIGPKTESADAFKKFKDTKGTSFRSGAHDENIMSSEGLTIDINDFYNKKPNKEPKGTYKSIRDTKEINIGNIKDGLMMMSTEGHDDIKYFYDKRLPKEPKSIHKIKNITEAYFGNVKDGNFMTEESADKEDYLRKWQELEHQPERFSRSCLKSCKRVYNNVCSMYKCSNAMKSAISTACHHECKLK